MASTNRIDHLTSLPNELLLHIFSYNVPSLHASRNDIHTYFKSHSLTRHLRQIAETAFSDRFVLQVALDIHCHDNSRHRWYMPFYLSSGAEDSPFAGCVRSALVRVTCQHAKFLREAVEDTMRIVRRLSVTTPPRRLRVVFDSDDERFVEQFIHLVREDVEVEFAELDIIVEREGMGIEISKMGEWKMLEKLDFESNPSPGLTYTAEQKHVRKREWKWAEKTRRWVPYGR